MGKDERKLLLLRFEPLARQYMERSSYIINTCSCLDCGCTAIARQSRTSMAYAFKKFYILTPNSSSLNNSYLLSSPDALVGKISAALHFYITLSF